MTIMHGHFVNPFMNCIDKIRIHSCSTFIIHIVFIRFAVGASPTKVAFISGQLYPFINKVAKGSLLSRPARPKVHKVAVGVGQK